MNALTLREERMAPFFVKHHLEGIPRVAVLHHFTAPDGGHPHDHPWPFTSFIVAGGYDEEVFDLSTGATEIRQRRPGQSFRNEAGHVHRIVSLPDGECWTLILPESGERTPGFYEFGPDGYRHRFWHEPDFSRFTGFQEVSR